MFCCAVKPRANSGGKDGSMPRQSPMTSRTSKRRVQSLPVTVARLTPIFSFTARQTISVPVERPRPGATLPG